MSLPLSRVLRAIPLICLGLLGAQPGRAAEPATVAAASDLKFALEALESAFRRHSPAGLRPVFGASGHLAQQIAQGAPFELFLSADTALVERLRRDGHTEGEGRIYALGRLALVVPQGSRLALDPSLADLAVALEDGRLTRFAIANPAHAPYGARAREVLQAARLWRRIKPYLVLGENVAQAAQFTVSGSVDGGLIASSLAQAPALSARARYVLIPADRHTPLEQTAVLLRGAGPVARDFHAFLFSPVARRLLEQHGYALP